ncbi:MAG: Ig-like domain-containing protein [Chitinophagales bacterium]
MIPNAETLTAIDVMHQKQHITEDLYCHRSKDFSATEFQSRVGDFNQSTLERDLSSFSNFTCIANKKPIAMRSIMQLFVLLFFIFGLQHSIQAQCPTLNSDSVYDKSTKIMVTTYHSHIAQAGNEFVTWGEDMAADGTDSFTMTRIIPANGYNYTGTVLNLALSGNTDAQAFLLTTTGLWSWGSTAEVVGGSIVSSNAFSSMTLPGGVTPTDVLDIKANSDVFFLITNSGDVWLAGQNVSQVSANATATANTWYQARDSTAGNPFITNVVELTGSREVVYVKKSDNTIWAWGRGVALGNGRAPATKQYATQVDLSALPVGVTLSQLGTYFDDAANTSGLLALGSDGKVYGMGYGSPGEIINNTTGFVNDWTTLQDSTGSADITDVVFLTTSENSEQYASAALIQKTPVTRSILYTWGESNTDNIGQGPNGLISDPQIPNGYTVGSDHAAFVSVGGHATSFNNIAAGGSICFVGHVSNGSGAGLQVPGSSDVFQCFGPNSPLWPDSIVLCGQLALENAPVAVDDYDTTSTGVTIVIIPSDNDTDLDNDINPASTTVILGSGPFSGFVAVNANGEILYTPSPNYFGVDSFQYAICDSTSPTPLCDTASVFITVEPIFPVAIDDYDTTLNNSAVIIDVAGNDVDDNINDASVDTIPGFGPSNGTLVINGNGSITYTPDPNSAGNDQFNYLICDNSIPTPLCDTATVFINIQCAPLGSGINVQDTSCYGETILFIANPPVVGATYAWDFDTLATPLTSINSSENVVYSESGVYTVELNVTLGACTENYTTDVIIIDSLFADPGKDTTICSGTSLVLGGSIVGPPGAQYLWTPNLFLDDNTLANPTTSTLGTITYTVTVTHPNCSGSVDSSVTVTVSSIPAANAGNDTTVCNGFSATLGSAPVGGLSYQWSTTTGDLSGETSSFLTVSPSLTTQYYVTATNVDGCSGIDSSTITIVTCEVIATNDDTTTLEDTPIVIAVTSNDIVLNDVLDNDSLTIISSPTNGTAIDNGDGTVTYSPAIDFVGIDAFEYVICDVNDPILCDTATVTVTVLAIPDTTYLSTPEETSVTTCTDILTNLQGGPFYQNICGLPVFGNLSNGAFPCIIYTPSNDFNGNDTICIVTCNSAGFCDTTVIVYTVTPVNDPPIAVDDNSITDEDIQVIINVISNDSDPDGSLDTTSISTVGVLQPINGSTTINGDGTITYDPDANFVGMDQFEYIICDTGTFSPIAVCDYDHNSGLVNDLFLTGAAIGSVEPGEIISMDVDGSIIPIGIVWDTVADPNGIAVAAGLQAILNANLNATNVVVTNFSIIPGGLVTLSIDIDSSSSVLNSIDLDPDGIFGIFFPTINSVSSQSNCFILDDILCDTALVTVTVQPQQDTAYVTLPEDSTITVCTDSMINIQGTGTLISSLCGATDIYGSTTNTPIPPCITYTTNSNATGNDSVCVVTCDAGSGLCDTTVIIITITPVNDQVIVLDDATTTDEEVAVAIDVINNDSDIEGPIDSTSVVIIDSSTNGTLLVDPVTGVVTYTPNTDFNGVDTFTYSVCDLGSPLPVTCDQAEVIITVNPINDAPIAVDDSTGTNEETTVNILVIGNDSDPNDPLGNIDPSSLDTTGVLAPSNGTIVLNPDGSIDYTPNIDFNGTDVFEYIVCDDGHPLPALCDTALVEVTVLPVNDAPIAEDTAISTLEDQPITICPVFTDVDGTADSISILSCGPTNGGAVITANDSCITYTPDNNYVGSDQICYVVCDAGGLCDTATVSITVLPQPDTAYVTLPEDSTITVCTDSMTNLQGNGVLVNSPCGATDVNGTTAISGTDPLCITYTTNPNATGNDSVCVITCDAGSGLCDTTVIIITITPLNDPVIVLDDAITTDEEVAIAIDVINNDSDIEGPIDSTSVVIIDSTTNGTLIVNPVTGVVTYTPNTDFNGVDTFTYSVCDLGSPLPVTCDQAEVIITVNPINDAPIAVDDSTGTNEETTVNILVIGNDSDPNDPLGNIDPSSLDTTGVLAPSNGTIVLNPDGSIDYTPNTDFNGTDVFEYIVCDDGHPLPALCDTALVEVTVLPVNDAPIAEDTSISTLEDQPITICPVFTDVDGTADSISLLSCGPTNGGAVITANDSCITYTPDNNYVGSDEICYVVCDAGGLCDTATISITVLPQPDTAYVTLPEDSTITVCTDSMTNLQGNGVLVNSPCGATDVNGTTAISGTDPLCITYTTNSNATGNDSVCVVTCDAGSGLCDTTVIIITITPVNDPPVAEDTTVTTQEDVAITICPVFTDVDGILDSISTISCGPTNGGAIISANDSCIIYTPAADFVGIDQICYTVCDAAGLCDEGTITVNVLPGIPDTTYVTIEEDGSFTLCTDSITNLQDPIVDVNMCDQGDLGVAAATTAPCVGYVANANQYGQDTICIISCTGAGICDTSIIVITIDPVNDQPTAIDDAVTTQEDTPVDIDVTANDNDNLDPLGNIDPTTVVVITNPSNGTAVVDSVTGVVTYTPELDFVGVDAFEYVVCDDGYPLPALCDTALVTVTVLPGIPDTTYVTIEEDGSFTVCTDSITNLQDPIVDVNMCDQGDLGVAAATTAPCVGYVANTNQYGQDTICIISCTGAGICDTSIVVITIDPVNDQPTAIDDAATTQEDTPVDIDVTANDNDNLDPLGNIDPTTVVVITNPSNGTAVVDSVTGVVTYTPELDFVGVDEFEYVVCDDGYPLPALCDTALVTVTVLPGIPDTTYVTIEEDGSFTVCTDSITNFQDPITTIAMCDQGSIGTGAPTTQTCVEYVADANVYGQDTICIVSCVGTICDTSIVVITINPVNDQPTAIDDAVTTQEDTPVDIDVTANDNDNLDPLGNIDPTTVVVITGPSNGTAVVDSVTGVVTYTPELDFVGVDEFEYVVCDDGYPLPALCDTALVTVTVLPGIPDTTYVTIEEDGSFTVCTDSITNFQDPITTIAMCDQGSIGTGAPTTQTCVEYVADANVYGQDTICIVSCVGTIWTHRS